MLTTDDLARLRELLEQHASVVQIKDSREYLAAYRKWDAAAGTFLADHGEELCRVYESVLAAEDAGDTLLNRLEGWGKAYPVDMFSEPTDDDLKWLHATRPGLCDRISASMSRHMAGCIDGDVKELRRLVPLATAKGGE